MNDLKNGITGVQEPGSGDAAATFVNDPGEAFASESDSLKTLMRSLTDVTIYIRESDLMYFRIEEWKSKANSPVHSVECHLGEGELPFVYALFLSGDGKKKTKSEKYIALVKLVDFLYRTTGTGLGIRKGEFDPEVAEIKLDATAPAAQAGADPSPPKVVMSSKPSGVQYDLKIGRRYRYATQPIGDIVWIERVELGRRKSVGGSLINFGVITNSK